MTEQKSTRPWVVLSMLFLVTCFGIIAANSIPPLFAEITKEIPLTKTQMGAIMGMFPVAALFFAFIGGGLSDKIGARWVIGGAGLIVTAAVGLRYFAGSAVVLGACMFFIGAGFAAFMSIGPKILGSLFPRSKLAMVSAIAYCSVTLGTFVALSTSARFLSPAFHGWRNTMLVMAAFCLASTIAWLVIYRDVKAAPGAAGSNQNMVRNFGTVVKIKEIWLFTAFYGLQLGAVMSLLTLLPVTLPERGVSREFVSIMFVTSPLFKIVGGIVSDKLGRRKIFMVLGELIPSLCIPGLAFLAGAPLVVVFVLLGISGGLPPTMLQAAIIEMEKVGVRLAGTAMGFITSIGTIGGLLGPVAAGRIMDASGGSQWLGYVFIAVLGVVAALVCVPAKFR